MDIVLEHFAWNTGYWLHIMDSIFMWNNAICFSIKWRPIFILESFQYSKVLRHRVSQYATCLFCLSRMENLWYGLLHIILYHLSPHHLSDLILLEIYHFSLLIQTYHLPHFIGSLLYFNATYWINFKKKIRNW